MTWKSRAIEKYLYSHRPHFAVCACPFYSIYSVHLVGSTSSLSIQMESFCDTNFLRWDHTLTPHPSRTIYIQVGEFYAHYYSNGNLLILDGNNSKKHRKNEREEKCSGSYSWLLSSPKCLYIKLYTPHIYNRSSEKELVLFLCRSQCLGASKIRNASVILPRLYIFFDVRLKNKWKIEQTIWLHNTFHGHTEICTMYIYIF